VLSRNWDEPAVGSGRGSQAAHSGTQPAANKPRAAPEAEPSPPPQSVADFRSLAHRLSFAFYWHEGEVNPITLVGAEGAPEPSAQRLFIPYCSNYLHNAESYSQLLKQELAPYDALLKANDQHLRKAAEESLGILLLRVRLDVLNECYGTTPSTSIRRARAAFWDNVWRRQLQGESDAKLLKERDEIVKRIREKLREGDELSAVVKYADMDAVDRSAELWQRNLLPWTKKTSGPIVAEAIISIQPHWARHSVNINGFITWFQALHHFSITNGSGKDLTHMTVEAEIVNEWEEKAANYYFIPELKAGTTCHLMIHPRWASRRLYGRDMTLRYSVWAAERSNVGRTTKLNNPQPIPRAEEYRKNILSWDNGDYGKTGSNLAKVL